MLLSLSMAPQDWEGLASEGFASGGFASAEIAVRRRTGRDASDSTKAETAMATFRAAPISRVL